MTDVSLDPLSTSATISRDYRRYLASLMPLSDGVLAQSLERAIASTPSLTRGPFLESTPPYATGASIRQLIDEGVLPKSLARFDSSEMPLDRPLYQHQELATRKARAGRNVMISTGTGSGKTESFLLPIMSSLAGEMEAGTLGPGVRAVLLYPMNALANDQVKRLRRLLAGVPEVTFGRYVGDTKATQTDAASAFSGLNPGEPRLPNELLSREEMQTNPPHILLTNYAMLEYLLLRPKDMDLFEGQHGGNWKFIVVDEAHVYDGARGSELAMLLRRLRNRVAGGDRLQCIATSATVGADSSQQAVTGFATNLFGSPFEWKDGDTTRQDLVTAKRSKIPRAAWGPLSREQWADLAIASDPAAKIMELAPSTGGYSNAAEALGREQSMVTLRTMLKDRVAEPTSVARRLGDDWTARDLVPLVEVGAKVVYPTGVPVLSSRYHVWVRASEGAFSCLDPLDPHVTLSRREICEDCDRPVFELASCVRCGSPYVLGTEKSQPKLPNRLAPRESFSGARTWVALSDYVSETDEDDESWEEGAAPASNDAVVLCVDCGTLNPEGAGRCAGCAGTTVRPGRLAASHAAAITGCVACGSRSPNAVRQLDTGQDASTSVVATSLYQNLPPDQGDAADYPGGGRKLLIFSDSRQGAAFFAPYLETSYQRILQRRLLLRGVRAASEQEGGPALLDDVVAHATQEAAEFALFPRRTSAQEKARKIGLWLAQELVAMDDRQSLEGLGLIKIGLDPDAELPPSGAWDALGLSSAEGHALVVELLKTVRKQGAVTFPSGIAADDESFAPRLGPVHIREYKSASKLLAWNPADNRNNRRLDYVSRVLSRLESEADPAQVLAGIWKSLTRPEIEDPVLKVTLTHRTHGSLRQLDYTWLQASVLMKGETLFQCNLCRQWTSYSVRGVCPAYRCAGTLTEQTVGPIADDTSHYRALYRDLSPIPMSVMEHTAQWRADKAAEIQNDFVKGKVNTLSCSTTFELGVDVGELQAVLLKNVPPRTANYVQRAGRAGRRTGSAALVVTMAQRRSHDLAQFAHPEEMIAGEVRPPVVPLENSRIDRRHAHSIVLSAFFRWALNEHGQLWRKSGDFFAPEKGNPDSLALLQTFIKNNRDEINRQFEAVLAPSVLRELDLTGGGWVTRLEESLMLVRREVESEIAYFDESRENAASTKKYGLAQQFERVVNTIRERDLLGFLGSRNILPKYGFPSDVVELKTSLGGSRQGAQLELNRDLAQAIYEFAPGAQIVAGGLKWTSAGVYRLPNKELVSGSMATCSTCGFFEESNAPLEPVCGECGSVRSVGQYIRPEFGFVADRDTEKPGVTSPRRARRGETHHLGGGESHSDTVHLARNNGPHWPMQALAKSRMVAVSTGTGAGFVICDWCGRGWVRGEKGFTKAHRHAWKDQECTGPLQARWLAHEYETDVLTIDTGARGSAEELWSLLYALLEGAAEELSMARDDLDGTISFTHTGAKLVLFDTVPGGAGCALRVAGSFQAVVDKALRKVEHCECGPETACYSCLRGFRNQMRHDLLSRGAAAEQLRAFRLDRAE